MWTVALTVALIVLFVSPLPEFAWDLATRRKRRRAYREYVESVTKP